MALVKFEGKPIEKLIDTVKQAIGVLYEPTRIRRLANAEAYKIEKLQEAEGKALLIKDNFDNELLLRTQRRFLSQEIDRQINIDNIVSDAVNRLPDQVSDTPVDKDWRNKFFNKAQDVSSQDLQMIWSQILANEIESPGTVSLRTLDILSSVSKNEAAIFERICKLSFNYGSIIKRDNSISIENFGVSFNDILDLAACGLMYDNTNLNISYDLDESNTTYLGFGKKIIKVTMEHQTKITFNHFKLTPSGTELMNVLIVEKDLKYLEELINYYSSKGILMDILN